MCSFSNPEYFPSGHAPLRQRSIEIDATSLYKHHVSAGLKVKNVRVSAKYFNSQTLVVSKLVSKIC